MSKSKDKTSFDPAALLKSAGLKVTPARVTIVNALASSKKPLSIKGLVKLLNKKDLDQVTIYRTLDSLKEASVVRQIDMGHTHAHYELADAKDHHHVICTQCNRVEDFMGCNIAPLVKKALMQTPSFDRVSRHSLELFGLCKKCSSQNKKNEK